MVEIVKKITNNDRNYTLGHYHELNFVYFNNCEMLIIFDGESNFDENSGMVTGNAVVIFEAPEEKISIIVRLGYADLKSGDIEYNNDYDWLDWNGEFRKLGK